MHKVTVITKDKCDQCGIETSDRYLHPGWIRLGNVSFSSSKSITISISIDRTKEGRARTAYFVQNDPLDFCGLPCLNKFLTKMLKKEKKKLKKKSKNE